MLSLKQHTFSAIYSISTVVDLRGRMPPHQLYPKGHNYARHYIDQHRCVGLCDCYGEGYAGRESEGEKKREREKEGGVWFV